MQPVGMEGCCTVDLTARQRDIQLHSCIWGFSPLFQTIGVGGGRSVPNLPVYGYNTFLSPSEKNINTYYFSRSNSTSSGTWWFFRAQADRFLQRIVRGKAYRVKRTNKCCRRGIIKIQPRGYSQNRFTRSRFLACWSVCRVCGGPWLVIFSGYHVPLFPCLCLRPVHMGFDGDVIKRNNFVIYKRKITPLICFPPVCLFLQQVIFVFSQFPHESKTPAHLQARLCLRRCPRDIELGHGESLANFIRVFDSQIHW